MPPPPYLGRARLGNRLNAFRLGHYDPTVHISVGGTLRAGTIQSAKLIIRDVRGAQPSTATFETTANPGWTPTRGQAIQIGVGALTNPIFGGQIESVAQSFIAKFSNVAYTVTCTDYTKLLNRRKVWTTIAGLDAGAAALWTLQTYTSGFSADTSKIVFNLGTVPEMEFAGVDVTAVLDRLAGAVGAIWFVDYARRLHFCATSTEVNPAPITSTHPTASHFNYTRMLRQARTRVYVMGAKTQVAAPVGVGETILPVLDCARFVGGTTAVIGSQVIAYTGTSVTTDDTAALVSGSPQSLGAPTVALGRSASTVSVFLITRSGSVATVVTAVGHGFAVGLAVKIAGAVENDYNGTFTIASIVDTQTFTYAVPGSPTSPASGTITSQKVAGGGIIGLTGYKVSAVVQRTSGSSTRNLESDIGTASGTVTGATLDPPAAPTAAEAHSASTVSVSFITRSGGTATVTTGSAHGYAVGMSVTIAGAVQTQYNATITVLTVGSSTTFTYAVSGSPTTPATGTMTAQAVTSGPLIGSYRYRQALVSAHGETLGSAEVSVTATEVPAPTSLTAQAAHSASAVSVNSISRSGTVATVTTSSSHDFGVGMTVRVAGAVETNYNGDFTVVSVTSGTVFTMTVSGSPATPSTGTITVQAATSGNIIGEVAYRHTHVTASGESIAGPVATFTGTAVAAPGAVTAAEAHSASTVNVNSITRSGTTATVTTGSGHGYAVGMVVTIAGAVQTQYNGNVTLLTVPATNTFTYNVVGSPATPATGTMTTQARMSGPLIGDYRWVITYLTRIGETAAGTVSSTVTGSQIAAPSSATTAVSTTVDGGLGAGNYYYVFSYLTAIGETMWAGDNTAYTITQVAAPGSPTLTGSTGGAMTPSTTYYYLVTYYTSRGETGNGSVVSVNLTSGQNAVALTAIPTSSDGRVVGRRIYRALANVAGTFRLIGTIDNNSGTTFTDNIADAAIVGNAKDPATTNTTGGQIGITSFANSGDARVVAKRIYRTKAGGTSYFLLDTIPDNATTSYTDASPDSELTQSAPYEGHGHGAAIKLTALPVSSDARVIGRKIYRTEAGGSTYKLVATIGDNTTVTYTDVTPDQDLGAIAPSEGVGHGSGIKLGLIIVSDPRIISRRIYRTVVGGTAFRLLATINDNTQTTFTDIDADDKLGETAPSEGYGHGAAIKLTLATSSDPRVMSRSIYRTVAGGTEFRLVATVGDTVTTTFTDRTPDLALGGTSPATNTFGGDAVVVTSIPIGPAGTVARKLYRLQVGTSVYRFVGTIGDNTTLSFTDAKADVDLGDEAPAESQLGPVAGDTTLRVSDLAKFNANGGWTVIAGQPIRYTGRAASSGAGNLTGIPATGVGSIVADLTVAAPIVNRGYLTGVSGVVRAVEEGAAIRLRVMCENTAAQTALAALVGGDGIHEHPIDGGDQAMVAECQVAGNKELDDFDAGEDEFSWTSRDPNTATNRTVSVALGAPHNITADFMIQTATWSQFEIGYVGVNGQRIPIFPSVEAQAGRTRLTLEDLLRMVEVTR